MTDHESGCECFGCKAKTLNFGVHGRTRDKIVDGVREDGVRFKATTDELGNTVTEHATKDDRVDVNICPQSINVRTVTS